MKIWYLHRNCTLFWKSTCRNDDDGDDDDSNADDKGNCVDNKKVLDKCRNSKKKFKCYPPLQPILTEIIKL